MEQEVFDFAENMQGEADESVPAQDVEPAEVTAESTQEEQTAQTAEEPPAQEDEPAQEPYLTVKHNHEEHALTREEARQLAQKGMNYDHVAGELQRLRDDPAQKLFEQLAQQSGMTREEYLKAVQTQMEQAETQKLARAGVPESYARELLESKRRLAELEAANQATAEKLREQERREAAQQIWARFFDAHPDVKSYGELPTEVKNAIAAGEAPESAYTRYENAQLKEQVKKLQQQQENRDKAPGSAASDAGAEEADGFMRGLLGL